ncbi:MAG: hypothetical protein ABIM89_16025 [Mycobacteriales bacterium]
MGLYCATPALGDLVQRSQLRGWTRTTGVIVTGPDGDVAVRYDDGGDAVVVPLPGWLGEFRKPGARVETWVDPGDPQSVILADNTPLHLLRPYGPIAVAAFAGALWLALRARRLRRAKLREPTTKAPQAGVRPGEWLVAAAVPLAISVGALGWVVANPEIEGVVQLGLAALMYVAALFGLHRWMVAEQRGQRRGSDAA